MTTTKIQQAFATYVKKVRYELDIELQENDVVGKWCCYYKHHMREVFKHGKASLQIIIDYCDEINFNDDLYNILQEDKKHNSLDINDIQEALECALIIQAVYDDPGCDAMDDESEVNDDDQSEDDDENEYCFSCDLLLSAEDYNGRKWYNCGQYECEECAIAKGVPLNDDGWEEY